jgi:hypothetical protein
LPTPMPEWMRQSVQEVTDRYAGRSSDSAYLLPVRKETVITLPVPSKSAPLHPRHVEVRYVGEELNPKSFRSMTCDCPAYTKWHKGLDCSHIKLVKEALADGD